MAAAPRPAARHLRRTGGHRSRSAGAAHRASRRAPGIVVPVREVAGTEVAQVCVGSSVNSGYEDLALVAAVLRDRTPAARVGHDRHAGVAADPGHHHAQRRLPGSRDGGRADAGAGLRSLRRAWGRRRRAARSRCGRSTETSPDAPGRPNDRVYLCSPATAAATRSPA